MLKRTVIFLESLAARVRARDRGPADQVPPQWTLKPEVGNIKGQGPCKICSLVAGRLACCLSKVSNSSSLNSITGPFISPAL